MYEKPAFLLAGKGVRKFGCSVAPLKFIILISDILLKKKLTSFIASSFMNVVTVCFAAKKNCYCVGIVSVMSASHYQSRSSMYV